MLDDFPPLHRCYLRAFGGLYLQGGIFTLEGKVQAVDVLRLLGQFLR